MPVTHAQIEPTTRCNFICGFCAGRHMHQQDLAWEAFSAFLDGHPDLRRVELQGEGEPLLHPLFFEMVEACAARGIAVGLITNGSLLNEDAVERLLAGGIESIHISLESADPAQFATIRGGRFSKVRDGISRLIARRGALGLALPVVGLAVTVLRSTLPAFEKILQLYQEERLDGGIVLQMLQPMPAYSRHYTSEMLGELIPPELAAQFRAVRAAASHKAPIRSTRHLFYLDLFADFDPRTANCPWLEHGAYLTARGDVTGCCYMKDEAHVFGGVSDLYRAATSRAALARALDRGDIPTPCAGCGTAASIVSARRSLKPAFAP